MLWELSPLVELVKGHGLQQTAWMLTVRGRFDPRGLDDAAAEASRIDARLRALLVGATSGATTRVPLHVLPEGWAVVPPDAQQHLDVEVRAIAELGARPDVLKAALAALADQP